MMRSLASKRSARPASARLMKRLASCFVCSVVLLGIAGCASGTGAGAAAGSANTTASVGANMAGAQATVHIPAAVLAAKPKSWDLSTPQAAVRSYLDWTSYASRIAQSNVAMPTMSADQGVKVDSYIQYNLEKKQLIDQTLSSITLGAPSTVGTSTLVPATEHWTYSYRSIDAGNKILRGPYTASYETTYTVVKSKQGWVVSKVAVKPVGTIK